MSSKSGKESIIMEFPLLGNMGGIGEVLIWSQLGSVMATIMLLYTMYERFFPYTIRVYITNYLQKLTDRVYSYVHVSFAEFTGERDYDTLNKKKSDAYIAIQTYLSAHSSQYIKRLRAEVIKDSQTLVLGIDDNEEILDRFRGYKVWWSSSHSNKTSSYSSYYSEGRLLTLTFHERHRDFVTGTYIPRVLKEGKAIRQRNRRVKLYTNNPSKEWSSYKSTKWSHVNFEHPSSFETLAMDPKKKEEILNDLDWFKNGKEYYDKIGKAWKRGYLLFGPPGTGKSSMIAAIANFMNYDVYDLELTAVWENTDLRKLLIETTSKSIIVIEDIDCSVDLTGQRKKTEDEKKKNMNDNSNDAKGKGEKMSYITLSGLLNFIDGIWSACGGERIIIFTTNYVEKLDPALIRRGRMDKHIEMSYCCYEAFKVLAKNYLDLDSHHTLFPIIEKLLGETNITPADVAENLMPKSIHQDSETCLKDLIQSLEETKKKAQLEKAKEKAKMDEEARLKKEQEEVKLKAN